jgi:putative MFS transporter
MEVMNDASVVSSGSIGARLDRLPLTPWHRRILILIGTGMFLDAFDINLGAGVLGALVRDGWSTLSLNAAFVSVTFIGMTLGAAGAGLIGDRYGRRLSYQINLAIFGGASLLAAFAPNMTCLIVLRFFMGIGLGAEIVVGYATLTEFVPAGRRGYWICMLAVITNASLFVASALSLWLIPHFGWRCRSRRVGSRRKAGIAKRSLSSHRLKPACHPARSCHRRSPSRPEPRPIRGAFFSLVRSSAAC